MYVTDETSHEDMSPLKDAAWANMPNILVTEETSHDDMSPLNEDAPQNIVLMSVTCETSHDDMSPLNEEAVSNMPDMSVIFETSHDDMSPWNDVVSRNIRDMSVTRERSGVSVARYAMLEAPRNASCIVAHLMPPHCSIDISLAALVVFPPRCIRAKSPDIRMVWLPGVV